MRPRTIARLVLGTLVAIPLFGVVWLFQPREDATTASTVSMRPPGRGGSEGNPPRPPIDDSAISTRHVASPSSPSSAPSPSSYQTAPAGTIPAVRLRFEAPSSIGLGQTFEYSVTVDARQSVTRISLVVTYDPALLRARSLEEVDYTTRANGERTFATEESSDGRLSLFFEVRPGSRPMGATERVAVVQFDAIASGWAQIGVEKIEASDAGRNALSVAVPDRLSLVAVN